MAIRGQKNWKCGGSFPHGRSLSSSLKNPERNRCPTEHMPVLLARGGEKRLTGLQSRFSKMNSNSAWTSPGMVGVKITWSLTELKGPMSPSVTCKEARRKTTQESGLLENVWRFLLNFGFLVLRPSLFSSTFWGNQTSRIQTNASGLLHQAQIEQGFS